MIGAIMEKLRKYVQGCGGDIVYSDYDKVATLEDLEYNYRYIRFILSPEAMFIKRLVDNDKIDLDKLKDNVTFTAITHSIGIGRDWRTVKEGESIIKAIGTNAIIAYLSIQDKPIEFLISILK